MISAEKKTFINMQSNRYYYEFKKEACRSHDSQNTDFFGKKLEDRFSEVKKEELRRDSNGINGIKEKSNSIY